MMTEFLPSPPAYQDPQEKVNQKVSNQTMISIAQDVFGMHPTPGSSAAVLKRNKSAEKIDQNIIDPLNAAIDDFNSAIDNVMKANSREAYLRFEQVISNATQAFNNSDQTKDLKTFQESMKAALLLIFSSLAIFAYDEQNDKPFFKTLLGTFPQEKTEELGQFLENIVKKSIEQKQNIKTSKSLFGGGSKKKPQEILDPILRACFPHISKAKNWITAAPNLSNTSQTTVTFNLLPQYLPRQNMSMLDNLRVNNKYDFIISICNI